MNHIDIVTTYGLDALSVSSHQSGKTPGKQTTMSSFFETVTRHSAMSTALGQPINRRSLLKLMGIGTAVLAVGVTGAAERAGAQSVTQYKTTTALNFRSGPGTSYSIIRVIPAGGIVAHTGKAQNSFYEVGYGGTYGWVHKDYLAPVGGSTTPVITGEAWTISAVNLRSGPSTSNSVLRVVPSDARIGVSTTVQNGFRYVSYQGQTGWMYDAYISFTNGGSQPDPAITGQRMTTSAVNLRSGPSTSNSVLRVVPSGSLVQSSDTIQNGYRYVVHLGVTGWIADSYLALPTDMGPVPSYQTTTSALNLRAEPSTSARILLVIPSGAKVSPNGDISNGFAKVTYNGTSGWAFRNYLI